MARTKKNQNAAMKVKVPGSKNNIEKMKYEIANEFGVNLGANATSRDNGLVGGEITKRLVEKSMNNSNNSRSSSSRTSNSRKSRSKKKS